MWENKALTSKRLKQYMQSLIIIGIAMFLIFEGTALYRLMNQSGMFGPSGEKDINIAKIEFNEVITSEYVSRLINRIEDIKANKDYEQILLMIESPGGNPAASHDLAAYLEQAQKEIPITFYVSTMAASGSYYATSVAKEIIANPNSLIGSVGVMLKAIHGQPFFERVGVVDETITSGKFKEPYSIFKGPTSEMKKYLKGSVLNPVYKNFIHFVASRRGIDDDIFREKWAAGRVFIASEVVGTLVDRTSTYFEVVNEIKAKIRKAHPNKVFEIGVVDSTPAKTPKLPFSVSFDLNLPDAISQKIEQAAEGSVLMR